MVCRDSGEMSSKSTGLPRRSQQILIYREQQISQHPFEASGPRLNMPCKMLGLAKCDWSKTALRHDALQIHGHKNACEPWIVGIELAIPGFSPAARHQSPRRKQVCQMSINLMSKEISINDRRYPPC